MADYTVQVVATTEEAEKKLKRVDDRVIKLEKGASIDIRLPSAAQTLSTLQQIGSTTASVAKQAIQLSKALNVGPGARLNDVEDLFALVGGGAKKTISAIELLKRATPTNILGTAFTTATDQASNLAKRISNVGYEIFGVTQSVNILRQAFGGLFEETIGREIRLQESLLRTRTTLASTADVAVNGKRLTDPYQALIALEGPIDKTLENIRRRSLDIAGTTSEAIVQVFGVVASQVGQFGGSLKDAEDLAITFAGALGTIGMADPGLASQEIRSILSGTIDQNSVLARSLGLRNEDIQKAKTSTEGLVGFLQRRLEAFSAGQSIAARGFAGITSNIAEVRQEAMRSLGKPLLQPLLDSLTQVYTRLQLVFDQILSIADGMGRIGSSVFSGVVSGVKAAPILQGFSERDQIEAFKSTDAAVADIAVRIQTAIDSIRPQIAALVDGVVKGVLTIGAGLGKLAAGFAQFKFEELKIAAASLTKIIGLLNATLIPVLSKVLSVYGQILALPVFQYLSQLNAQLEVLERIGVLPAVRLSIALVGIAGSVKVVIGWVKTAIEAIRAGLNFAVNAVADGVKGLGISINSIGKEIIGIVTQTTVKAVLLIANAIIQIGVQLVQLGVAVTTQFPAFSALGQQISSVGAAFINIEKGAQQAAAGIQRMATSAKQALGQVERSASVVAEKTRNIGSIVGGFVADGFSKLAGSVGTLIKGLVIFQLQLFAIEKLIGFGVDQIARWKRRQDEISDQTRAELAVARLSTVYSDLGDNTSAATKALKAFEEQVLSNRIETLTKSYTELINKMSELEKFENPKNLSDLIGSYGVEFNPEYLFANDKDGTGQLETRLKVAQKRTREEAERARRELERLQEFQSKRQTEQKDAEDVQILARERKDIEIAIGELRKGIERELKDERFKAARELAQLEQSIVEEGRRAERAELDRRLAREAQGLTGVRAQIAQILGDYERGLFDAQTEAQRRQFEAVQARENLEKSIADYKYRLEEQTFKLRTRLGDYNKRVSDYETDQAKRRDQEKIKTALRAAAIEAERFVLGPAESGKFKDAAARAGVSSTQALSLLKTPGVIDSLGIIPDGNYDGLMDALKKGMHGGLLAQPQAKFINSLDERQAAFGVGAGRLTYNTAVSELGNQREFQRNIPAPAPLKGFEDFKKEEAQFVAEKRDLEQRINDLRNKLESLSEINRSKENLANAQTQLSNPNLLTDLPSLQTAQDQVETALRGLSLLGSAFEQGQLKIDSVTQKLSDFDESLARAIGGFTKSLIEARNNRLPPNKRVNKQGVEATINFVTESFRDAIQQSLAVGKPVINEKLKRALDDEGERLLAYFLGNIVNTRKNIQSVTPLLDRAARLSAVTQDVGETTTALRELVPNRKLEALTSIGAEAAGDSPLKQRIFEAEMINLRRSIDYTKSGKILEPENRVELERLNAQTTATYEELGRFEEGLKSAATSIELLRGVAASISDGYKNVIKSLLDGGDIRGVIDEFSGRITESFLDAALQAAFKPAQDMLEKQLQTVFGVNSEQVKNTLALSTSSTAVGALNTSTGTLTTSVNTLNNTMAALPSQIQSAIASAVPAPGGGGDSPSSSVALPSIPYTEGDAQTPKDPPSDDPEKKDSKKLLKDLNKGFSAITQSVVGVTMAMDGLRRVTEGGGTYETLMGLSAIFMGVGSVMSGIGSLGKKARGGPVQARTPYLVGERGPELFLPETFGSIVPNTRTNALMASRGALGGSASAQATTEGFAANRDAMSAATSVSRERYVERVLSSGASSTEIQYSRVGSGDLPFVTEANMLQATRLAAQEGARMGQQRTLAALRNDPSARRGIGI